MLIKAKNNKSQNAKTQAHKGFTLAEVLVTLGIIGVVAALLILPLFHNTQDAELKAGFKKMYSSLNQALEKTIQENGNVPYMCYSDPTYHYSNTGCGDFWADFKKQLNITKEYTGPADAANFPNYTGTDLIVAQGGNNNNSTCTGGKASGKSHKLALVLADGSMIISYSVDWGGNNNSDGIFLIVDTNGVKKPNKWGYDLFIIEFIKFN